MPASRQALKIPPDAYVVHFAFDTHSTLARKNPLGVVEAFLKAFDSDHSAYLLLKARNLSALQEMADRGDRDARKLLHEVHVHPRIRLVGREVSRGNALGLLALSDCHLSLHRAEGFGYGMAEAMALGVPVVATGYSGNMAFMDSQNSWPVAYQLRSVNRGEYLFEEPGFRWAEPDIDDAAEQLIACRTGQDRQHRIDLARMRITENFSLSVMSRRMSELLERRRR